MHLFDADGNDLGLFVFSGGLFVANAGGWIAICLSTGIPTFAETIYYPDTTDCSGPAYVSGHGAGFNAIVRDSGDLSRFWLEGIGETINIPESGNFGSISRSNECVDATSIGGFPEGDFSPVQEVTSAISLTFPLALPLAVLPVP